MAKGQQISVKHPTFFNLQVMSRFLDKKGMEEFYNAYYQTKSRTKYFQAKLVKKALGDRGFDQFCDLYASNKKHDRSRGIAMPTQDDHFYVKALKAEKTYGAAERKCGISHSRMLAAAARVSAWS